MIITVADRFSFTEREIMTMPYSKLKKWYDRVCRLMDREYEVKDGNGV